MSEDQLIEIINNNTVQGVRNYFQENNISSVNFNNFNQTLLYLVKQNASSEIIEFIIENQHDKSNKEPLFYCIDHENFKIANILLDNDANINGKLFDKRTPHDYCNILEYIRDTLTEEKFDFIFRHKGRTDLVSSRFICYIIINSVKGKFYYERNGFDILRYILNYKYTDHNEYERNLYILNHFLLKCYKNKYPLTNEQITLSVEELERHVTLPFNNFKNKWNIHPVELAISVNNTKLVELLFDYANKHRILLDINRKRSKGIYCLLDVIRNNNEDILRSLFNYANDNDIVLNITDSDIYGNSLLELSLKNNDDCIIESLLNYADDHDILIHIEDCISLLNDHNVHSVNILIDYADRHSLVLNLNVKNSEGKSPLLCACSCRYSMYYVSSMFRHANKNSIILNVNDKDQQGNYPLLNATKYGNQEMVKCLLQYAMEQRIPLIMNDIDQEGNYPLLYAVKFGEINMVKDILCYALEHHIILKIMDNNKNEENPICCAKCNPKMIELLCDYGKSIGIPLKIPENDE